MTSDLHFPVSTSVLIEPAQVSSHAGHPGGFSAKQSISKPKHKVGITYIRIRKQTHVFVIVLLILLQKKTTLIV